MTHGMALTLFITISFIVEVTPVSVRRGGASRHACPRRCWYKGTLKFMKNIKSHKAKICINFSILPKNNNRYYTVVCYLTR